MGRSPSQKSRRKSSRQRKEPIVPGTAVKRACSFKVKGNCVPGTREGEKNQVCMMVGSQTGASFADFENDFHKVKHWKSKWS